MPKLGSTDAGVYGKQESFGSADAFERWKLRELEMIEAQKNVLVTFTKREVRAATLKDLLFDLAGPFSDPARFAAVDYSLWTLDSGPATLHPQRQTLNRQDRPRHSSLWPEADAGFDDRTGRDRSARAAWAGAT